MKKIKAFTAALLAAILLLSCAAFLPAADQKLVPEAEAASAGKWISSWSTAAVEGAISLEGIIPGVLINDFIPAHSVIRTELQISAGGLYTKLCFSNEYGTSDLHIGAVSIAKTAKPGSVSIDETTATAVTFRDGQESVVIKPGEVVWSDSVYFKTAALENVTVSMYFPRMTYIKTTGLYGGRTFLNVASGKDALTKKTLPLAQEIKITSGTITYHTIPFLTRLDVRSVNPDAYTVVFLGDSTLTNEAYHYFAQRAYAAGYGNVGFVNNSIVANRLLHDGVGLIGKLYGTAVEKRFKRDALDVTGADVILVKIGLNDILHPMTESMKDKAPYSSVEDIIAGYERIIAKAHAAGKQIYFFKKSAWKGYEREFLGNKGDLSWTAEAQEMCDALDKWITTTNKIDGYIDLDKLDNPVDSAALLPAFTTDGAHLTSLGALAMADLIPGRVIGASALPSAATINGVDPYASVDDIIANHKPSGGNNNNNSKPQSTTSISESIAASVLASRQDAANGAVGKPTTTKPATKPTTTKPASKPTTTKPASATVKATQAASSAAASIQASVSAQVTTTAAASESTTVAVAESAGDLTPTVNTVVPQTTAPVVNNEVNYFSVSVDQQIDPADEMAAAEQPVVAEKFSGNGTTIGIVLVVLLVAMVGVAVVITMKTRRRGDM